MRASIIAVVAASIASSSCAFSALPSRRIQTRSTVKMMDVSSMSTLLTSMDFDSMSTMLTSEGGNLIQSYVDTFVPLFKQVRTCFKYDILHYI
jgi:hypothetical protein